MVYSLNGLRHYAIVGGNDKYYYIRYLRAPCAHRGERLMARGIYKGYLPAVAGHGIRAYVLRNAAGFALRYAAMAYSVKQAGLAVVNMAHYSHHGRTLHKVLALILVHAFKQHILIALGYVLLKLYIVVRGYKRACIKVYFLVYGSHYAQYEQLLYYLGNGLAYLFAKLLYRYGLAGDNGLFYFYRLRLWRRRLLPLLLPAAEVAIFVPCIH